MSDTTSLSSNYSVTATFAKEFNGAVLTLKRRHLAHDAGMIQNLAHHGRADFITALRVEVDFVDRAAGCIYGELQAVIIGRLAKFSRLLGAALDP